MLVVCGISQAAPLPLSLSDAVQRGLKYNLSALAGANNVLSVRAERLNRLSALLPDVTGNFTENVNQINLVAQGLRFTLPPNSPFKFPTIVGPYGFVDARIILSQKILDVQRYQQLRSADANVKAAELSLQDTRDLVVQAVANAYLLIISDASRVETAKAQVATSQSLFLRAVDQNAAGTVPKIDRLRAEVELQSEQQLLVAATNRFAKDKLSLAHAIGLPLEQDFDLTDSLPFAPLTSLTLDAALKQAYENRNDYRAMQAQLRAAELTRSAAVAEYFPTLDFNANYGDSGVTLGNSHGVFAITGGLRFNIFTGGRIRSEIDSADAALKQRRDELNDLRSRIDLDIRSAFLDLKSAADQVAVARRSVDLANETLTQSKDRFIAGVANNIEVVQAQQALVSANQDLISSSYSHNLAKISLARGLGLTEQNMKQFLGEK